ncbi:MAG: alpha/beta fold hydrolase [Gemmatimonadota bacterium]
MRSSSFGLLLATTACLAGPPAPASSQESSPDRFVGAWEGTLEVGQARLRLVFHVARNPADSLTGTLDSPDQGAFGIPASSVVSEGDRLRFAVDRLGASYLGTLSADGTTMDGVFTQVGQEFPLVLTRAAEGAAGAAPGRPQNPEPPYPYRSEEVRVANPQAGDTLAGTLTLPDGEGPFPAAVLVSGSGPQDRDETLLGHKPFLVLSDHLTRQGIAVLRYDDRGVGKSTGTFSSATSEDFTSDALAAVAFLKGRDDIGPVGIIGHSEGGLVGPMAAVRSSDVAYVVMLAGPGLPGRDIIQLQSELIARADGTPEEYRKLNTETQSRLFDIVTSEPDPEVAAPELRAALEESIASLPADVREEMGPAATPQGVEAQVRQVNSPWFRFFLTYDPRPTLEKVRVPVLALNGEKDLQVPPEQNIPEIAAALKRGGNPDATTTVLPGLNHLFQKAGSGSPAEYATIEETMDPAALQAVSDWILERFGNS